jgi:hypothetical protein
MNQGTITGADSGRQSVRMRAQCGEPGIVRCCAVGHRSIGNQRQQRGYYPAYLYGKPLPPRRRSTIKKNSLSLKVLSRIVHRRLLVHKRT